MFGLNTAAWDSELGSPVEIRDLQQTGLTSYRYPGGSWADAFDWTKPKYAGMPMTKDFARMLETLHATGSIIVNYGSGTPQMAAAWAAYCESSPTSEIKIGVDSDGFNWKDAGYWGHLRESQPLPNDDGFNGLRAGHKAPFPISQIEIGNECYGGWEYDAHQQAHDPVLYAEFYAEADSLIKLVAPNLLVGAVVTGDEDGGGDQQESVENPRTHLIHTGWTSVVLSTLYGLRVIPDFVIYHYYPEQPGSESDTTLLASSRNWSAIAVTIRQLLTDYLRGKASRTQLQCTENNAVAYNPGKQSTSLVDGLYLADSFGSIIQTEFTGYYWWCLHNGIATNFNNSPSLYGWRNYGDYGILSQAPMQMFTPLDTPYPTFRAMEMIKHFCAPGDSVVSAISDNADVAVYAVKEKQNGLSLLVINKNPTKELQANILIGGYRAKKNGVLWNYGIPEDAAASEGQPSDIVTHPLTGAGNRFVQLLPPYSITVDNLSPK